ncbi:MAG TPA: alkaline phosphatase D family protein [Candidatus Synoicihabitans sp.]|nr:alkaline phosphatase D family protein [Candidatus Synoicihabitans sp.]
MASSPLRLLVLLICFTCAGAHAGDWVSGPLLGYRAHREALIWLETRGAQTITLTYQQEGQPQTARTLIVANPAATPAGVQPVKFVLPLLELGAHYTYSLSVDGVPQSFPYPLRFTTADLWEWRKPPPDFSFLFGSCAYLNDPPYDRPGKPYGHSTEIFQHMARSGADFMIWGGDNVYLREADYSSRSGIWYRYSHDRAHPDLQPLLAAMHHYATWDDHDYGPDNANWTFEFKDVSLAAFQAYWANPSWGSPEQPGVFGKFVWGDAAFFLMDDRYYRDESTLDQNHVPQKFVWGARQLEWLKQSLLHSQDQKHSAFKFIVTGGQVIQTAETPSETHELYRREREELITFIAANRITGVVFLTGDVHHSALYRRKIGETQHVYELTSSPLTSGARRVTNTGKAADPALVPGSIVGTQNYCQVFVRGTGDGRELFVRCFDDTNALQWEQTIPLTELR